jgi:hypothetical protein
MYQLPVIGLNRITRVSHENSVYFFPLLVFNPQRQRPASGPGRSNPDGKGTICSHGPQGIPALEKLLSDDLYYIHSNGSVDTKESFINSIKTGERYYDNIEIEDILVRIYGNTGIINGVCTYYRTDASNLKLRYTNVYVKDKRAGWQMVSWQSFKME